jgi:hypothetical protein
MVNFELRVGSSNDLLPNGPKGTTLISVKDKFALPARWLVDQIQSNNIGVVASDVFVEEVSKSKLFLMDLISRPEEYREYDLVVCFAEKGNYQAMGYQIDRDVHLRPMNGSQELPVIKHYFYDAKGHMMSGWYSNAYYLNTNLIRYVFKFGLNLLDDWPGEPKHQRTLEDFQYAVDQWFIKDRERENEMILRKVMESKAKKREASMRYNPYQDPTYIPKFIRDAKYANN